MESSIWEMQREAERRVQRMEQLSHRYAQTGNAPPFSDHRAATVRAHKPPPVPPIYSNHNLPPANQNLPQKPEKRLDREQLFLLALTVFLAKNGGSPTLILALLYLAF